VADKEITFSGLCNRPLFSGSWSLAQRSPVAKSTQKSLHKGLLSDVSRKGDIRLEEISGGKGWKNMEGQPVIKPRLKKCQLAETEDIYG